MRICFHTCLIAVLLGIASGLLAQDVDTAQARIFRDRANAALNAKQDDSTRYWLAKARAIYQAAEIWDETVYSDVLYAVADFHQQAFVDMAARLKQAEAIADEHLEATHDAYPLVYQLLGVAYDQLGDYDEGLKVAHKSLDLRLNAKQISSLDSAYLQSAYNNLGVLYGRKGDYEQAALYYQKSLNFLATLSLRNPNDLVVGYANLGQAYHHKGDSLQARRYFLKSLTEASDNPNPDLLPHLINSYQQLIFSYLEGNKPDSARHYFQALLPLQKLHPFNKGGTYRLLGRLLWTSGQKAQALDTLDRALREYQAQYGAQHPKVANLHNLLGKCYLDKAEYLTALEHYQEGLTILCEGYSPDHFHQNPQFERSINGDLLVPILRGKAQTLYQLSQQEGELSHLEAAFRTNLLAVNLLGDLRRSLKARGSQQIWLRQEARLYEEGVEMAHALYQKQHDPTYLDSAFMIMEISKAALLVDEIRTTQASNFAGVPDSLLAQERQLKIDLAFYESALYEARKARDSQRIARYENYLFARKQAFDRLKAQLESDYAQYYQLAYATHVPGLDEIRNLLPDRQSALVEYLLGEKNLYIFGLTHDSTWLEVRPAQLVWEVLPRFRAEMIDYQALLDQPAQRARTYYQLGLQLYEHLIEPMSARFRADINTLLVIPDGILGFLPFEALVRPLESQDQAPDFIRMPYLLHQYTFTYVYSATLLVEHAQRQRVRPSLDCLGLAPAYQVAFAEGKELAGNRGFRDQPGALPWAQAEVQQLQKIRPGQYYLGSTATKKTFLDQCGQFRLIHLAMHGQPEPENPYASRLLFAANAGESDSAQALFAYELIGLGLGADLVVLSACASGYGQYRRGEGVMSLGREFLLAGAQQVVMSLWRVEDRATAALMEHFYQQISKGAAIDRALKEAKIAYLSESDGLYAHPFFWAGFVSLGKSGSLVGSGPGRWSYLGWILAGLALAGIGWAWYRRSNRLR